MNENDLNYLAGVVAAIQKRLALESSLYAPAFTSGTANYFWATPNGAPGVPSLRAIVAADIPALSYEAAGAVSTHNGLASAHGFTTAGKAIANLTNPGAITFLRVNADNTASLLSASDERTALGLAIGSNVQAYNSNLTGINQALDTTASPSWVTGKFTALTDGYIPYHVSDAAGLANSPLVSDGTSVGLGVSPSYRLHIQADTTTVLYVKNTETSGDEIAIAGHTAETGNAADTAGYLGGYNSSAGWYGVYGTTKDGVAVLGNVLSSGSGYAGYFYGNIYTSADCSALSFTDRTPYPESLAQAWAAIHSMRRKGNGLDHDLLHPFVKHISKKIDPETRAETAEVGRNISATLSALVRAMQDVDLRLGKLEVIR